MWKWLQAAVKSQAGISNEERVSNYQILNASFEKTLIFRFGDDAGFFSELNNLALAVLYCLDNRIRFVLYTSGQLRISLKDGWNDYFQPFCEQVTDDFHRTHNERFRTSPLDSAQRDTRESLKRLQGFDYYTYELWDAFRSSSILKKHYRIHQLDINDDFYGAMRKVLLMLWRFSEPVEAKVRAATQTLALPQRFVGLHVRGGDKTIEAKVHPASSYISKIPNKYSSYPVFLLTDDYRIYQELADGNPSIEFRTLCKEVERGFHYESFIALEKREQYDEYVKLIVSMEILRSAEHIVGTYTSNPGMFLGLIVDRGRFVGVDSTRWLLTW